MSYTVSYVLKMKDGQLNEAFWYDFELFVSYAETNFEITGYLYYVSKKDIAVIYLLKVQQLNK